MTKPQLRREISDRLRDHPAEARARASRAICGALARHPAARSAAVIAVFDPLPSEPDIASLRELLPESRFCYPRCEDDALVFYFVESDAALLPVSDRRFREPDPACCAPAAPAQFDAILVPGVAFSPDGTLRLGRGGGFYDRFLAHRSLNAARLGVCFSLQLRDDIPQDPHDQPVDEVITEEGGDR